MQLIKIKQSRAAAPKSPKLFQGGDGTQTHRANSPAAMIWDSRLRVYETRVCGSGRDALLLRRPGGLLATPLWALSPEVPEQGSLGPTCLPLTPRYLEPWQGVVPHSLCGGRGPRVPSAAPPYLWVSGPGSLPSPGSAGARRPPGSSSPVLGAGCPLMPSRVCCLVPSVHPGKGAHLQSGMLECPGHQREGRGPLRKRRAGVLVTTTCPPHSHQPRTRCSAQGLATSGSSAPARHGPHRGSASADPGSRKGPHGWTTAHSCCSKRSSGAS